MRIAKVIKILDEYTLVINKGDEDGVKIGDVCLIYKMDDEELVDPDTNEKLGFLEIVKGIGKVTHTQQKISTITSNEFEDRKVITRPIKTLQHFMGDTESFDTERKPFKNPEKNDLVKKIR